ncbi:unnamed protein product, partial [Iphiclides podalirius]
MIPSQRGKNLLMLDNYTFSQMKLTHNFYCSKKDSGCKARVKLFNGSILKKFTEHNHPPPKYVVTPNGFYVKIRN